jgi:hypothetical protein
MKLIIGIVFLICNGLFAQTISNGCFKEINIPAEYIDVTETIIIDEISYNRPIIKDIDKRILTKDKAIEEYYEFDVNRILTKCFRVIDATYEVVRVPSVVSSEKIIVREHQVITKTIKRKNRDGYIAIVPCDKIINSIK